MNTSIKPHACCRYKQGAIDCILQIVGENQLSPEDIDDVQVSILKAGFPLVAEPRESKLNPKSVVDAQFSMPFGGAVAIVRKDASLDQYSMENVTSATIHDLMPRIRCVEDPEIEIDFPKKWRAKVEITTREGLKYRAQAEHPKGDPGNPLSWDEIIRKFTSLAGIIFPEEICTAVVESVRDIENTPNVQGLLDGLQRQ